MGVYFATPPEEGGGLTHKETGPHYTLKESFLKRLWGVILKILQNAWAKRRNPFRAMTELVVSFVRLIAAIVLASFILIGRTLARIARYARKVFASYKTRLNLIAPDIFSNSLKTFLVLLGFITVLLLLLILFMLSKEFREIVLVPITNPLALIWTVFLAIAGVLRWIILPIKPDDSTNRSYIRLAPIGLAILSTIIYLFYVPAKIIHDFAGSAGSYIIWTIAGVLLVGLVIYIIDRRTKTAPWIKLWKWFTHPLFFVALGIIALNWLYWVFDPLTWMFFWAQPSKFWGLNISAWLGTALLSIPKRDKDGKNLDGNHPIAGTIARLIITGVVFTIGYNALRLNFWPQTSATTVLANRDVYATGTPVAYSPITDKPLPAQPVADAESGTRGVLGSAKQFLPGTTTPVRNPQNGAPGTGAVGKWAINLSSPAVKSLVDNYKVDGKGLDVENNEAHNDAAASLLYEESGLRPWTASKHCWGDKIDGYLAKQSLPYVLDVVNAPVGTWSEKVLNPMVSATDLGFSKTDDNKGGMCEYMVDGNPKEVFPFGVSKENRYPSYLQFRCTSEGAEIRVRVVPK